MRNDGRNIYIPPLLSNAIRSPMNSIKPSNDHEIFKRIHNDLVDSFDEELEMDVEDGMLPE
jgi:hypothetical protein